MVKSNGLNFLKSFRFRIYVRIPSNSAEYDVHTASMEWEQTPRGCCTTITVTSAVPHKTGSACHSESAKILNFITQGVTIDARVSVLQLDKNGETVDGATTAADVSEGSELRMRRTYDCSKEEYTMDELTIRVYGEYNPFA